jgi:YD repeat-containing protein
VTPTTGRYPESNSTPDTVTFTVTGDLSDTYTMSCSAFGGVTCISVSPTSKSLAIGRSATVTVVFSLGVTDGQVYLTATGHAGDQGWYNVTVKGKPVVDVTPYNWDKQDIGRWRACGGVRPEHGAVLRSTRPATSLALMGPCESPIFARQRESTDHADQTPAPGQSEWALVTFVNTETTLNFAYTGTAATRIGGEFIDSTHSTGVYPMDILVSAVYPSTVITTGVSTKLVVVNETTNPVARGWTVAGVQHLYLQGDGSALITEGDGSAVYFAKNGAYFTAPAGEFSSLTSGSGYTRRYPDSTKAVFDNSGRMIKLLDRFGNRDSVTYDANGRIWKLTDPQNLTITLAYGANGLSSISDAGSPARVTNVTVDASKRLTAIQDPDGISTTFGYDASLRLCTITNRNGKTTTLGYDANAGTLTAITGPSVAFYDGTAAPVESLFTWQKVGVPYAATSERLRHRSTRPMPG